MALEFPLYRQTSDFSCGPASLVMALHALRGRPVTRSEEFELWRVGNMIGIPGMDQWGLALSAHAHVPVTVISTGEVTFPHAGDELESYFSRAAIDLADFAQRENLGRARRAAIPWQQRPPTLGDVRDALAAGRVPVLLVDLFTLSRGADFAPHWVVATRVDGGEVTLHDPAPEGPGRHVLSEDEAWNCTDVRRYQAQRTVVLLGP